MPTENENKVQSLIDVGEEDQKETEINLDDKGEPEKIEEPVEEKIEVEEVSDVPVQEDKREKVETKKEEKDELKEYSEGVQKRIAKLTRKMREAERQKEEAIAFAEANKKRAEEVESKLSKLDKTYVSEFESRVKTNLAAAKLALKTAIDSQDVDAQVAAQEQIANLTVDAARLNAMKVAEVEKPKEVNVTPQRQQTTPQSDPKAEEWAARNAWFGNDTAMTYTAFDLHKKLTEEEGFDAQSDDYYAEIDKRMRLDFPHKFGKTETTASTKPTQTVASAKRSVNNKSQKTVRLTPSQVTIAKKLGVPLELYAKQLNITKER